MSTLDAVTPTDVDRWLQQRRRLGLDQRDEIWAGAYRVAPYEHTRNSMVAVELLALVAGAARAAGLRVSGPFNLGEPGDFRIPDAGLHRREQEVRRYMLTAAVVVEVLSPGDATEDKMAFYRARGVREVWVLDPLARTVQFRHGSEAGWRAEQRSVLLGLAGRDLQEQLDWP